ncbi:MAG TPA: 16S rRNA (cytidine(1402)-2'-O)-methyltransferase [Spongiibacteraceae bacterium]|nr:16S rRNA (cytidine(1402)-2'-O)-methyltransferase [Spongiibacteraceae bacterium]
MVSDAILYVVATPIGNLGDMVPRAVSILQSVDLIAAEDTRHSRRLLDHFDIRTRCVAYHDHSSPAELAALLADLNAGRSIALISDAGTPLVSDPGYRLVDAALSAGIKVVPIPGPCAVIAALSAAGLPTDRFVFEGFLPAKMQARRQRLELLLHESRTLVFYEAPHRLLETLSDFEFVFGAARVAVVARELTKLHETIYRAPLGELHAWAVANNQGRGECVLLLQGDPEVAALDADSERVLRLLLEELPLKQAAALAAKITGQKKNELYQLALSWQKPA